MATEGMKQIRVALWAVVAVAALVFGWLVTRPAEPYSRTVPSGVPVSLGGPFTLTGTDGKPFSSAALAGQPYAVFFGFTNCPDVCPNTLGRLARLRGQLGADGGALKIVFVSVDPQRDTPKVVGDYVGLFGTPIIGLTGSEAEVAAVAKQHGIFQRKVEDGEAAGGYTVDHGSQVLLFGRDGKFVSTIALEEGDEPALAKLKRILA